MERRILSGSSESLSENFAGADEKAAVMKSCPENIVVPPINERICQKR